jgi:putative NADPH-quinone reductase
MSLEWAPAVGTAFRARLAPGNILIVNGHPDPRPERFCAALCDAYQSGARSGGRNASRLDVGALAFGADSFLCAEELDSALRKIRSASQLMIVFPLWLDQPPAILRSLFGHLAGDGVTAHEVRTIITMEMPAFAHRALALDGGDTSGLAQRLSLPGITCQERVFIGGIDTISSAQRAAWLGKMREQGKKGL